MKQRWNIRKVEDSWTRSGRGKTLREKRGEELGKVFGRCFNGRVSHCSKGLGRKEQLALVTPTVVELTRKMLSTLRGVGEGERRERKVGRCEWSKKASAEYNNYFTSDLRGPGNWNFRATPGTKAAGSGAPLPSSLLARAVQNIFNYGIIICCLCRGECAPLLPAQIILI